MEFRTHTDSSGVVVQGLLEVISPRFDDERGFFLESFHQEKFWCGFETHKFLEPADFVQDNQSFSHKGVIRGLHIQHPPHSQGKLVRVPRGRVLDVAVDLRPLSLTFRSVVTVELSSEKQNALYIPRGFLHGFAALEDSVLAYKCDALYHQGSEAGVRWDDPVLGIDWGVGAPLVSSKDQALPFLEDFLQGE